MGIDYSLAMVIYFLNLGVLVATAIHLLRTRGDLGLIIAQVVVFYWTFQGVPGLVGLKKRGESIYYERELFLVSIDDVYIRALLVYTLFFAIVTAFIIAANASGKADDGRKGVAAGVDPARARLSPALLLLLSAFSAYVVATYAGLILSHGIQGIYAYQRLYDPGQGRKAILMYMRDLSYFILTFHVVMEKGFNPRKAAAIAALVLLAATSFVLGDRGILLMTALFLAALVSAKVGLAALVKKYSIVLYLAFSVILSISVVRGGQPVDYSLLSVASLVKGIDSNEEYAAHISMYGVLKNDIRKPASGIIALAGSLVPGFVSGHRPKSTYGYYVEAFNEDLELGVTIHNAASLYIDGGIVGVAAGSMLWGAALLAIAAMRKRHGGILWDFAYNMYLVNSIVMIRGPGIEVYKSILLMNILAPCMLMKFLGRRAGRSRRTGAPETA